MCLKVVSLLATFLRQRIIKVMVARPRFKGMCGLSQSQGNYVIMQIKIRKISSPGHNFLATRGFTAIYIYIYIKLLPETKENKGAGSKQGDHCWLLQQALPQGLLMF